MGCVFSRGKAEARLMWAFCEAGGRTWGKETWCHLRLPSLRRGGRPSPAPGSEGRARSGALSPSPSERRTPSHWGAGFCLGASRGDRAPRSRLPESLRKAARRNEPGPPGAILRYGSHARGGRHFAPEREPRAASLRSLALGAAILGYGSPSAYP